MARLCTVRGKLISASNEGLHGQVVFVPNRIGAPGQGALVLRQPIRVDLAHDGSFTVQLTPSADVGPYTVRTPGGALVIEVPATGSARFEDLVIRRRP